MEKHPIIHVGGDMESALKGEYNIDVQAVLKEAWALTTHNRKTINLSLLFILSIGMLAMLISSEFLGGLESVMKDPDASLLINIVVILVTSPFIAAVEMIGVYTSVGIKSNMRTLFSFMRNATFVCLCAVLSMFLSSIGFQLFILPGIYLVIALTLTMPLIIEKGLTPFNAIIISLKATRFQWFKLFALHMFLLFALLVSLVPLMLLLNGSATIIGLCFFMFVMSYLGPMYYHVKGILYREIFGLKIQTIDNSTMINSTFSA